jgi:SnoaL-like domain
MTASNPRLRLCGKLVGALVLTCALAGAPAAADDHAQIEDLSRRVTELEARLAEADHRIAEQEAITAARRLAFTYGYFMDHGLYDQIPTLFASKMDYCELAGYGRFNGHDGCVKVWTEVLGRYLQDPAGGLLFGRMTKTELVKDIVVVAPDGQTSTGRFDYFSFSGTLGHPEQTWQQLGVYRMGFVREDGVWKIGRFSLIFQTQNYNQRDWANNPAMRCPDPSTGIKADAPYSIYHPFPEQGVIPFEFNNPVTGAPIPAPVGAKHYWQGNWPGEFGGVCGKRPDADTAIRLQDGPPGTFR